MSSLRELAEWKALQSHCDEIKPILMHSLFEMNPHRFDEFSLMYDGLFLDYSKNRITDTTLKLLIDLAQKRNLTEKIDALFSGKAINFTENRPALHHALRLPKENNLFLNSTDINPFIQQALNEMESLVQSVISGKFKGYTGETITDIVNIGIGGSHLGPLIVTEALKPHTINTLNLHFLSNIHSGNFQTIIKKINPARTLFIISSKTFTTIETLVNAECLQDWFTQISGNANNFYKQTIAVTANKQQAIAWGIPENQILEFWEWVGGRYSVWSTIGLPIALLIGMQNFRAFLAGAHAMDQHFVSAQPNKNMPILLALLSIWYNNFFNIHSHVIIPYNYYLRYLPLYLQQLDMESNGKQINDQGRAVDYATGQVIWGEMGTNGQHAFHQLLHQGTQFIPADFIIDSGQNTCNKNQDTILFASCLGQSQALMQGISYEEVLAQSKNNNNANPQLALHKTHPGNRPSNTLLINKLTPYNLGALITLYEHKTFVQAAIWGINPFDQWGVELAKKVTQDIYSEMNTLNESLSTTNASTTGLLNIKKSWLNK